MVRASHSPSGPRRGLIMLIATFVAIALTIQPQKSSTAVDMRDSVKRGLKWLADAQDKDGSLGGNGGLYRTSTTAFAGLAFLMEGSTPKEGRHAANIRKAIAWFEANARPNGLLVPETDQNDNSRSTYAHACALLFLVSAYDVDDDEPRRKRFVKLIDAAVAYAAADRSSRGVWAVTPRGQSGDNEDTYTTVQMLDALVAAERVGLKLPDRLIESATQYLAKATNPEGGIVFSLANGIQPQGGDGQAPPTAAAAAILFSLAKRPEPLPKWVSFAIRTQPAQIARMGQTESNTLRISSMWRAGELPWRNRTPEARCQRERSWHDSLVCIPRPSVCGTEEDSG